MADLYPQVDLNQTRHVTSITQRLPFSAILILQRIGIAFRCLTGNARHERDLPNLRQRLSAYVFPVPLLFGHEEQPLAPRLS